MNIREIMKNPVRDYLLVEKENITTSRMPLGMQLAFHNVVAFLRNASLQILRNRMIIPYIAHLIYNFAIFLVHSEKNIPLCPLIFFENSFIKNWYKIIEITPYFG